MSTSRRIAIQQYMKRHGIKISWVADSIGISEALLRYHIKKGMNDTGLLELFKGLMQAHATAILEDLIEIQDIESETH
jgi:hypothetical protein